MPECPICCEKYNLSKKKRIVCQYCEFELCQLCQKKYFASGIEEFNCMNCHHKYDEKELYFIMPKNFFNKEYKQLKIEALFKMEQRYMKITQKEAEIEQLIEQKNEQIKALQLEINVLEIEKEYLKNSELLVECPVESCSGYIGDNSHCVICQNAVCAVCLVVIDKSVKHICDENIIKSLQEIKNLCKNCPNCNILINKAHGCDYMWCTNCNVGFSWKTGKIKRGLAHNPHRETYMHKYEENRKSRDKCVSYIRRKKEPEIYQKINDISNKLYAIEGQILSEGSEIVSYKTHASIRKEFLKGNINEEQYKNELYLHDKKMSKSLQLNKLFINYYTVISELFNNYVKNLQQEDMIFHIIDEENKIYLEHINQLQIIKKIYGFRKKTLIEE